MGLGVLSTIGKGHAATAIAGAFVLCAVAPIGGGILALLHVRRRPPALEPRDWEVELLRLAEQRNGSLTVQEVVIATGLEPGRSEALLDGLCRKGLAEYRVADEGVVVYRLRPALGPAQKAKARGVLE
jgi:hypothetical protein